MALHALKAKTAHLCIATAHPETEAGTVALGALRNLGHSEVLVHAQAVDFLRCAAGNLVVNELVPCDLGYAHRETLWVGFMT